MYFLNQQQQSGNAVRLRFGTEMSSGSGSSIASASGALTPLAEAPETRETQDGVEPDDEDDDVWSDTPVAAANEENGDPDSDSKASDELLPEPVGLESDFRFNLNDVKIDKILGQPFSVFEYLHPILGSLTCPVLDSSSNAFQPATTSCFLCTLGRSSFDCRFLFTPR